MNIQLIFYMFQIFYREKYIVILIKNTKKDNYKYIFFYK